jgi:hypothetical protein
VNGYPQAHQAETLSLKPSTPSFRSKSNEAKIGHPNNFSEFTMDFQAKNMSPWFTKLSWRGF